MNIVKEILSLQKQVHKLYCYLSGNGTGGGGGIAIEVDPTVPQYVKDITEANIADWGNNKTDNFIVSAPAGAYTLGKEVNANMPLKDFARALLTTITNPTYTAHTFTVTANSGIKEAGTTFDLAVTGTFNRGEIRGKLIGGIWVPTAMQNPKAGLPYQMQVNGQTFLSTALTNTKITNGYVTVLGENKFLGNVSYSDSTDEPINSEGAVVGEPFLGGTLSNQVIFIGGLKRFAGTIASDLVDGVDLRAKLNSTAVLEGFGNFSIKTGTVNRRFVIAIPLGRTLVSATNIGTNQTLTFVLSTSIKKVPDAGGTLRDYNVYVLETGIPFTNDYTINIVTT